jgi:hypothetical protein
MSDYFGMGVMIGMLGGNEKTVKTMQTAVGKTISRAWLGDDDALHLKFYDGSGIRFVDDGQSCCESRYMRTDDDLTEFSGAVFQGAEIKEAAPIHDGYGEHEVQFLEVKTSKGCFTMASHNEHNGYYGGFWIVVRPDESA